MSGDGPEDLLVRALHAVPARPTVHRTGKDEFD